MRVSLLALLGAIVLLSIVFQEAESHLLFPRRHHTALLRRFFQRRIRSRRPCTTQNGCFRNTCCVRDITTSDDGTSVTFNKFGVCINPTDFLNATLFTLNRIDDEIAAAADRAGELARQSIDQDSLVLCRPGRLGPQSDTVSIEKRSTKAQIDAARLVRFVQGPDVATVTMVDPDTSEEDSGDASGDASGDTSGDASDEPPTETPTDARGLKRSPLNKFKSQAQEAENLLASLVKELDTIQK